MKKIILSLLLVLLLSSCIKSQKSSNIRSVKISNMSSYELVFFEIDNHGDTRLWSQTSFKLQPTEEYSQISYEIYKDTPCIIAPWATTIECNGKRVHFSIDNDCERNPCGLDHYYKHDNFSKYGPGIHYEFVIGDSDIEKWFGISLE